MSGECDKCGEHALECGCKKQKTQAKWRKYIKRLYMKRDKWISVKDRKPQLYDFVFVLADNHGTGEPKPISIARLFDNDNGDKWDFLGNLKVGAYMDIEYDMESEDITHWMRLPKPPED